jgi:hypothetical protein
MQSKSEHILSLAIELMDDIELSRIDAQAILLKTTRLARYVDNQEIRQFLKFEMEGYNKDSMSLNYIEKTGRWVDKEKGTAYYFPLSQVEAKEKIESIKMQQLNIPNASTDYMLAISKNVTLELNETSIRIAKLGGIKSRVISIVHEFVTNVYYEKTFDGLAESIFDQYKKDIDLLIAKNSGDVIEQIPSAIARLSEKNPEAISQALTTCRRIIDSFADHIFPASEETFNIGGNDLQLKQSNVLNRINVFIYKNSNSESRKQKLRQNLTNLYSRLSAGVHDNVDQYEARNLFFNVYLILGEILTLNAKD